MGTEKKFSLLPHKEKSSVGMRLPFSICIANFTSAACVTKQTSRSCLSVRAEGSFDHFIKVVRNLSLNNSINTFTGIQRSTVLTAKCLMETTNKCKQSSVDLNSYIANALHRVSDNTYVVWQGSVEEYKKGKQIYMHRHSTKKISLGRGTLTTIPSHKYSLGSYDVLL